MAARRDYAKKSPPAPRRSHNTNRRKEGAKKPVPGWLWLLAGLSIGLFIAFLVSISDSKPGVQQKATAATQKKSAKKSEPKSDPTIKKRESLSKPDGVKFDFYHILPEMEVAIPKDEIDGHEKRNVIPSQYFIQVGSFKRAADAESRRAELFLLNFEPTLQTVTIDGKQSWHRVRIGPYLDRRKLHKAQRQLQNNDIDFITLKERQ